MANRFQEWLRLVKGVDAGKGKLPELSPRSSTLIGRAQLAQFLAQSALRPTDPLPYSGGEAVACELSREAIYWALLALREAKGPADGAAVPPADLPTLSSLWAEADRESLDRAAGGAGEAERLHADLLSKSFADYAELGDAPQAAAASACKALRIG